MSYGWAPYVPVAARRAKALKEMNKLRKKGQDIQPVNIKGNTIAKTFWGKGWCQHLENFSDYSNRLPRGRTYARNGSVCHLKINKGKIEAIVSGSSLYKIKVNIKPLSKKKWDVIQEKCSGQIGSILELLQGKLSNNIMDVVSHPTEGLFPLPSEIELTCNCPDWADLCKHLAAVLYAIGARLDESPELLFILRGVDHTDLISEMKIADTSTATKRSKKPQVKGDLSTLFGIDLDNTAKAPKKRTTVKGRKKTAKKSVKEKNIRPTGKTIVRLRSRFGMNLSQFAKLLNVSSSTISNWEKKSGQLNLKPEHKSQLLTIVDLNKAQAWDK